MSFVVVGAGMAGLLASAMLRGECAGVYERAPALPNNHSAVLRFRSSVVGDTLGIPFKKVRVIKAVHPYINPIAEAIAYSIKTNGTASLRSSISARGEVDDRYIAPVDLVMQMGRMSVDKIAFNVEFKNQFEGPVISTMPMPALMDALDYSQRGSFDFGSYTGTNIIVKLRNCDIYSTLYVPDPEVRYNRVSITGDEMIIEIRGTIDAEQASKIIIDAMLGCGFTDPDFALSYSVREQRYAKILPIEDAARKRFIQWASRERGVFSLGRYATWRPGLLMDDIVNDVRVIQRIVRDHHSYDHT